MRIRVGKYGLFTNEHYRFKNEYGEKMVAEKFLMPSGFVYRGFPSQHIRYGYRIWIKKYSIVFFWNLL